MTTYTDLSFAQDVNPVGNSETLTTVLHTFGETLRKELQCCTPAIVEEYYPEQGKVKVLPLVMTVLSNDQAIPSLPYTVNVIQHQSGNFFVHMPLAKGDTGWLIASDQDTTHVKNFNKYIAGEGAGEYGVTDSAGHVLTNAGPQRPNTYLRHQYSQGFFIPDKWGGISIPEELKESFVIQQILPDYSTRSQFIMDKDGTVHLIAGKWRDKENALKGGILEIDLRYLDTDSSKWNHGEIVSFAHAILLGDQEIKTWKDQFGEVHGGNLSVEKNVAVGESLEVAGNTTVEGELEVGSSSLFKDKVIVKTDNKAAIINPKEDLAKSDAKFREVTVVTGFKKKEDKIVKLATKKMRVLSDLPEDTNDTEFEVGDGGGDIEFRGTDDSLVKGQKFKFEAGPNSNIVVTCNDTSDIIRIGVYYL